MSVVQERSVPLQLAVPLPPNREHSDPAMLRGPRHHKRMPPVLLEHNVLRRPAARLPPNQELSNPAFLRGLSYRRLLTASHKRSTVGHKRKYHEHRRVSAGPQLMPVGLPEVWLMPAAALEV